MSVQANRCVCGCGMSGTVAGAPVCRACLSGGRGRGGGDGNGDGADGGAALHCMFSEGTEGGAPICEPPPPLLPLHRLYTRCTGLPVIHTHTHIHTSTHSLHLSVYHLFTYLIVESVRCVCIVNFQCLRMLIGLSLETDFIDLAIKNFHIHL